MKKFSVSHITQKADRKIRPSEPAQMHRQIFEFITFKAFGEFGCNKKYIKYDLNLNIFGLEFRKYYSPQFLVHMFFSNWALKGYPEFGISECSRCAATFGAGYVGFTECLDLSWKDEIMTLRFFILFHDKLDSVEWPLEIFYHKNLGRKRVFALKIWKKRHARKLEYKVGGLLCNSKYLRDIWIYTIISQYLHSDVIL